MPRATRLLIIDHLCRLREGSMGALVEVRRNAGQHTHNPRAIKRHELGLFLARGAQMHHDVIRLLQPLQPRNAPAEDLRLVGHARLARGCWVGQRALGLPRRGGVLLAEPTEPHRDLMRVVCLKQLMNPGRTESVARAICRMDKPASLAATMAQIRSRSASASRVTARRSRVISCCS